MRRLSFALAGILLALLLIGGVLAGRAAGFDLGWWTVDAGGGTSSGGAFTLSGSAGQADAGTLDGGTFHLDGGFQAAQPAAKPTYLPLVQR
jgi:hypothetical protein